MNSPFGPNSSSCAAVGAYAGPLALFDRVKTKTCPLEFTATPGTSPKLVPAGSFKKSADESNGISGTLCCANAWNAISTNNVNRQDFMTDPSQSKPKSKASDPSPVLWQLPAARCLLPTAGCRLL